MPKNLLPEALETKTNLINNLISHLINKDAKITEKCQLKFLEKVSPSVFQLKALMSVIKQNMNN